MGPTKLDILQDKLYSIRAWNRRARICHEDGRKKKTAYAMKMVDKSCVEAVELVSGRIRWSFVVWCWHILFRIKTKLMKWKYKNLKAI